jgi:hypothetical protein
VRETVIARALPPASLARIDDDASRGAARLLAQHTLLCAIRSAAPADASVVDTAAIEQLVNALPVAIAARQLLAAGAGLTTAGGSDSNVSLHTLTYRAVAACVTRAAALAGGALPAPIEQTLWRAMLSTRFAAAHVALNVLAFLTRNATRALRMRTAQTAIALVCVGCVRAGERRARTHADQVC